MTLASGATNGDKIAIIVYDVFNVTVDDAYTKSTADSRFINVTGDSMTGVLTIPDGSASAPSLTNTGDTDTLAPLADKPKGIPIPPGPSPDTPPTIDPNKKQTRYFLFENFILWTIKGEKHINGNNSI